MQSSKILKSIRGQRLKTQDEVASLASISRQAYCTYENNPLQCDLNILFKIFNVLEVTDEEISLFLNALKQDYLSCEN